MLLSPYKIGIKLHERFTVTSLILICLILSHAGALFDHLDGKNPRCRSNQAPTAIPKFWANKVLLYHFYYVN